MTKPLERAQARRLRAQHGRSVKAIAGALGVSVSSVSRWVADVPLTQEQEAALRAADPVRAGRLAGQATTAERARALRLEAQEHGRALVRSGDAELLAACMLFWAEGSRDRNAVRFANTDAAMVRCLLDVLRRCYGVRDADVRLRVNCFLGNGLSLEEIERWWLDRLALPPSVLGRATVNRASRSGTHRRTTHVHGTVHLVVHSTWISQSLHGAIQEHSGVDRPEWLDLRYTDRTSPPSTSSASPVT